MTIDATPQTGDTERKIIARALERLLGHAEPAAYVSRWRLAGFRENVEPDESPPEAGRPRRTHGPTRP
ncbi:MAG: hypothetical protein ICV59_08005 [Thermoleophilia bacterium]|nr:hypothetical protein [Thermoleophilia bacterium]